MAAGDVEALKARLRGDLMIAMRGKLAAETALLRTLIAAIDNAQAVPVAQRPYVVRPFGDGSAEAPRRDLSADDLRAVLEGEIESRLADAEAMARGGRVDRAEELRTEADLVRRYLPAG